MAYITAVFSNGHEDTYKGTRDVKAAWMITDKKTGKVLASGHSLDRMKAEKTAKGNLQYVVRVDDMPRFYLPKSKRDIDTASLKYLIKELRTKGIEFPRYADFGGSVRAYRDMVFNVAKDANAARSSVQYSRVNIEVIDL